MDEWKLQTDNVVLSTRKMKAKIALQIPLTTEQMVVKEISAVLAESPVEIPQCLWNNARNAVRSVIYDVVDQVLLNLLRRDVISESLYSHICTYFTSNNVTEKLAES